MDTLVLTVLIWICSVAAGLLGALTGLGGGVVIVPVLALLFGVNIRYAMGASLVSVIATSSGAAAAYVREGFSNIRIGMFLEIATTLGAISGALLVAKVSTALIAIVFGLMLVFSAYLASRPHGGRRPTDKADPLAVRFGLTGAYPEIDGQRLYSVRHVPSGFGVAYLAGVMSGLLGIGSGAAKVLAMDQIMRIPFKVSTATSNFMIGVTAAASAAIYFRRGYIDPGLSMPVMLGVLAGSIVGARMMPGAPPRRLRLLFSAVILLLAIEMLYNGLVGKV